MALERGQVLVKVAGSGVAIKALKDLGWTVDKSDVKGQSAASKMLDSTAAVEEMHLPPAFKVTSATAEIHTKGKYLKNLVARADRELGRIGIVPLEIVDGNKVFLLADKEAGDIPYCADFLSALADRSTRKVGMTQHPFTWFDLKQTLGLIQGAKEGLTLAVDIMQWADAKMKIVRDSELEILKTDLNKKKEARRVVQDAKAKEARKQIKAKAAKGEEVSKTTEGESIDE